MDTIRIESTGIGSRVIMMREADGGYRIMTQEHRSVINPYCPELEIMEDGWRPSIIEYASTLELAGKRFREHIEREARYKAMKEG